MASQLGYVTGNKRLRPNQLADLNARLGFLPQTLAAESQEKFQTAQISNMEETNKLNQARFGLEEQSAAFNQKATTKGMDLRERSEGMQAGIGAAGLGFNLFGNEGLKSTLGESINKVGSQMGMGSPVSKGGFWGDIPVGTSLAGGLMGFGASRMVPGKNKLLKFGVGAGVGALTGFFGGGGAGGATAGGILGGLGGLI